MAGENTKMGGGKIDLEFRYIEHSVFCRRLSWHGDEFYETSQSSNRDVMMNIR